MLPLVIVCFDFFLNQLILMFMFFLTKWTVVQIALAWIVKVNTYVLLEVSFAFALSNGFIKVKQLRHGLQEERVLFIHFDQKSIIVNFM